MEATTNNVLGIVAIIISVGTTILGVINHKRLRSKCCNRKIEIEFEVDNTRPISVHPPSPVVKPSAPSPHP